MPVWCLAPAGRDCTQGKLSSPVLPLRISSGTVWSGQCSSCCLSGFPGNCSHLEPGFSPVRSKAERESPNGRDQTDHFLWESATSVSLKSTDYSEVIELISFSSSNSDNLWGFLKIFLFIQNKYFK